MSLSTRKVMPWVVLVIAVGFTSIDTFTNYDITDSEMASLYAILAPFGLASVVKSGYVLHKKAQAIDSTLSDEDRKKLKELMSKVGL